MSDARFIGSGLELQAAAQILLSTEIEDFARLFPRHSADWTMSMYKLCQRDMGAFFCKLDSDNLARVFEYVVEHPAMALGARLGRGVTGLSMLKGGAR
jgi:hypothetical protein